MTPHLRGKHNARLQIEKRMSNPQYWRIRIASILLACFSAAACDATLAKRTQPIRGAPKVIHTDQDLKFIRFKAGRPTPSDTLHDALLEPEEQQLDILKSNLKLFRSVQNNVPYDLEVLGFSSANECAGSECVELSVRRAELTASWLVANGLPSNRLARVEGMGAKLPIGDESTEIGRTANRRAEINLAL
jgi:hypothetical protein